MGTSCFWTYQPALGKAPPLDLFSSESRYDLPEIRMPRPSGHCFGERCDVAISIVCLSHLILDLTIQRQGTPAQSSFDASGDSSLKLPLALRHGVGLDLRSAGLP